MLAYDETTRTLFSSDLFLHPGRGPALTEGTRARKWSTTPGQSGCSLPKPTLWPPLDKIDLLQPETLACHHGTAKAGHIGTHPAAFRHHDVTALVPSDPVAHLYRHASQRRVAIGHRPITSDLGLSRQISALYGKIG